MFDNIIKNLFDKEKIDVFLDREKFEDLASKIGVGEDVSARAIFKTMLGAALERIIGQETELLVRYMTSVSEEPEFLQAIKLIKGLF